MAEEMNRPETSEDAADAVQGFGYQPTGFILNMDAEVVDTGEVTNEVINERDEG